MRPAGVTEREVEVLRLVVSPRGVHTHVRPVRRAGCLDAGRGGARSQPPQSALGPAIYESRQICRYPAESFA